MTKEHVGEETVIDMKWMEKMFPDKKKEKLMGWLETLDGNEFCTLRNVRECGGDDWEQLPLPIAVRGKIRQESSISPPGHDWYLFLFLVVVVVCLCAYVLVCLCACVLVCLCACVLVYLCACVLVCLCGCVVVWLCAC